MDLISLAQEGVPVNKEAYMAAMQQGIAPPRMAGLTAAPAQPGAPAAAGAAPSAFGQAAGIDGASSGGESGIVYIWLHRFCLAGIMCIWLHRLGRVLPCVRWQNGHALLAQLGVHNAPYKHTTACTG